MPLVIEQPGQLAPEYSQMALQAYLQHNQLAQQQSQFEDRQQQQADQFQQSLQVSPRDQFQADQHIRQINAQMEANIQQSSATMSTAANLRRQEREQQLVALDSMRDNYQLPDDDAYQRMRFQILTGLSTDQMQQEHIRTNTMQQTFEAAQRQHQMQLDMAQGRQSQITTTPGGGEIFTPAFPDQTYIPPARVEGHATLTEAQYLDQRRHIIEALDTAAGHVRPDATTGVRRAPYGADPTSGREWSRDEAIARALRTFHEELAQFRATQDAHRDIARARTSGQPPPNPQPGAVPPPQGGAPPPQQPQAGQPGQPQAGVGQPGQSQADSAPAIPAPLPRNIEDSFQSIRRDIGTLLPNNRGIALRDLEEFETLVRRAGGFQNLRGEELITAQQLQDNIQSALRRRADNRRSEAADRWQSQQTR